MQPLIIPILTPSNNVHFASLNSPAASVDEVIQNLLAVGDVAPEILGDLEDGGWALQRVMSETSGRTWLDGELEALGEGMLSSFP